MTPTRVYLDNAATSWPKPEAVYVAVQRALRELGAPAGRSAYQQASEVERLVSETRRRLAVLLGVEESHRVIFTSNGTDSLNLALHGLLRAGDHVVTTVAEHNSVLRPLHFLESRGTLQVTRVACDGRGVVDSAQIEAAIRKNTSLIVVTHVSNVTGAIQPAGEIGRVAQQHGITYLVDGAQSLGHLPLSVSELNCNLLAAPAHKGLLGPLGLGILYVGPGIEQQLSPLKQGGTGTHSETDEQPDSLPDKYECGNHNVPAILGLNAALEFLQERGPGELRRHERSMTARLLDGLAAVSGVQLYGPAAIDDQVGVVSFNLEGYDPREVASMLDATFRIQARSGLHCAPRMHQHLGTATKGGTVRLSMGAFTTVEEIELTVEAIGEFAATKT